MLEFAAVISLFFCIIQGIETDQICWGCFSEESIIPCPENNVAEWELKCPGGDRFNITDVFYGQKEGSSTCRAESNGPFESENCSIPTEVTTAAFQNACKDKNTSCVVRFKEDFYDYIDNFMDPCENTTQFTTITYDCKSPSTPEPTQTSAQIPDQNQADGDETVVKATGEQDDENNAEISSDGLLVSILLGMFVGIMLAVLLYLYKRHHDGKRAFNPVVETTIENVNNAYSVPELFDPPNDKTAILESSKINTHVEPFEQRALVSETVSDHLEMSWMLSDSTDIVSLPSEQSDLSFKQANKSPDAPKTMSENTAKFASPRPQQTPTQSHANEPFSLISNGSAESPISLSFYESEEEMASFYDNSNLSLVMTPRLIEKSNVQFSTISSEMYQDADRLNRAVNEEARV